jgi:hypothetical protein
MSGRWQLSVLALHGLFALALLTSCAIPVRPIAKIATGSDGLQHYIPDPDQEPKVGGFIDGLLPIVAALTGAGGIGSAALLLLKNLRTRKALDAAVSFGSDMEKATTDKDADLVKQMHAATQEKLGVKALIDKSLNKAKT